ncbi:MAG: hypothetical protein HOP16_12045 [Acidobacteria bacterium]|nr:hypothetical protein [Acidobacteriota bacterium]
MTLNENLRFEDVESAVKRAFLRTPERVLLSAPTGLYKWTDRPLVNANRISPWWSFVESRRLPSGTMAEGFRASEERAARLKRPHREFARARAAVSGQFGNSMTNLLMIQLNEPAWGFVGQASGQREFADEERDLQHVFLIGGAMQVWVPNLEPRHVTAVPVRG